MPRPSPRARLAYPFLRDQVVVAVLYFATAQLAFSAAVINGFTCPVWPPTAIGFIAVLWRGRSVIPGLAIGVLAANATRPIPAIAITFTLVANVLEPLVAVAILRRLRGSAELVRVRDVGIFTVAIVGGAVISALGGTSGLLAAGLLEGDEIPVNLAVWFLGNVTGAICAAPLILVAARPRLAGSFEMLLAGTTAAVIGPIAVGGSEGEQYMVFPVLIWAGLRLGPRGAAAITLMLSGLTVAYASRGDGPFVRAEAVDTLLTAQGFILVTALTTLLLAAITEDRRRTSADLANSESAKRDLAEEQAALRRVATAVAAESDPQEVLGLVAGEVAALAGAQAGNVVRHLPGDHVEVVGHWGTLPGPDMLGIQLPVAPGGAVDQARRTGRPARFDERSAATPTLGAIVQRVAAPVVVDGAQWGAIVVATSSHDDLRPGVETRLARFAELAALAIVNADQRERLTAQATTDPLTGLVNHRAFHERLHIEVERAQRYGRPLSVAVFDIDHFKQVNDTMGHAVGDAMLRRVARGLLDTARTSDIVGRVGGDELAVILPEIEGLQAFEAADRLRRSVGVEDDPQMGTMTVSAGTCDLAHADDAEMLLRLADGALYWAKAHGRDACFRYTPDVVVELSATERAERLSRSRALAGIRALARAIDAKDPTTSEHSERVAEIAARLATVRGWDAADVMRLRAAGLVHDVGKIGVPDAILFKPDRLTMLERIEVEGHAELGAQLAGEVLDAEQAEWIHGHHERFDGEGYPRNLRGEEIPEGARLLALADAWDSMTRSRSHSLPIPAEAAYIESRSQAGLQFCPDAVAALDELWRTDRLDIELTTGSEALR